MIQWEICPMSLEKLQIYTQVINLRNSSNGARQMQRTHMLVVRLRSLVVAIQYLNIHGVAPNGRGHTQCQSRL